MAQWLEIHGLVSTGSRDQAKITEICACLDLYCLCELLKSEGILHPYSRSTTDRLPMFEKITSDFVQTDDQWRRAGGADCPTISVSVPPKS